MIIRFASQKDKSSVLSLLDELRDHINLKNGNVTHSTDAQEKGGKVFDEIIKRDDIKIFIAEENNQIVGIVTFYLIPLLRRGENRGMIEEFVVTKDFRGKGVGAKLFEAVKKYSRENDIKLIKLTSGLELEEAHIFYEKQGGKFTEKMFRFEI